MGKLQNDQAGDFALTQSADRLVDLESAVMHLQRDFERLSEVLLDHAAAIQELKRRMELIDHRLETVDAEHEVRDPIDERPPHY